MPKIRTFSEYSRPSRYRLLHDYKKKKKLQQNIDETEDPIFENAPSNDLSGKKRHSTSKIFFSIYYIEHMLLISLQI